MKNSLGPSSSRWALTEGPFLPGHLRFLRASPGQMGRQAVLGAPVLLEALARR